MAGILDGLNESQKRAVMSGGHVLVVAGPGTGKTMTIVRRIARLGGAGCATRTDSCDYVYQPGGARDAGEDTRGAGGSGGQDVYRNVSFARFADYEGKPCVRILPYAPEMSSRLAEGDRGTARAARKALERISRFKNGWSSSTMRRGACMRLTVSCCGRKHVRLRRPYPHPPYNVRKGNRFSLAPGYPCRFAHWCGIYSGLLTS